MRTYTLKGKEIYIYMSFIYIHTHIYNVKKHISTHIYAVISRDVLIRNIKGCTYKKSKINI